MTRISSIREELDISLSDLAKRSRINSKRMLSILKGKENIEIQEVISILKAMNHTLVTILTYQEFRISSIKSLNLLYDKYKINEINYPVYIDDFLSFAYYNNIDLTIKSIDNNHKTSYNGRMIRKIYNQNSIVSGNQQMRKERLTYCMFCGERIPFKERLMREHSIQKHDIYVYDDPVFRNKSYKVFFSEKLPKHLCSSPNEQMFATHKAISSLIYNKRGTIVQEKIKCSLCGIVHSYGFRYRTNVGEIILCTNCKGKFKSSKKVQIIHNPIYTREDSFIENDSKESTPKSLKLSHHDLIEQEFKDEPQIIMRPKAKPLDYHKNEIDEITLEASPEFLPNGTYKEGATMQVTINKYERNREAREKCIKIHGCFCNICGFDFEKVYGAVGKQFIHVHHIIPLSEIREGYQINPKEDLIPVCPNCHAMLHKKIDGKVLSVKELQMLLKN